MHDNFVKTLTKNVFYNTKIKKGGGMAYLNRELIIRWVYLFVGCFILGLGIASMNKSGLGVPAVEVIFSGLYRTFGISYGFWLWIGSAVFVIIAGFLRKEFPRFTCLITSFLQGISIDLANFLFYNKITIDSFPINGALFFLGLIYMVIGIAMTIISTVSVAAVDELVLAIKERFNLPNVGIAKYTFDLICLAIGYFIGGSVGIGTVVAFIIMGGLLQIFYKQLLRLFDYLNSNPA